MYSTDGVLPVSELPSGTRLLGASPPMLGIRRVAHRFLAQGLDDGEGAVVVGVNRDADTVVKSVGRWTTGDGARERLAVVDATGSDTTVSGILGVERVSSPADLTGIGVSVTRALETLYGQGVDRVRLVVDSLSSLLVYADFESVYRFAHTIGARVQETGAVGLFLVNADTDGQIARFEEPFEGTLSIREGTAGPEWRLLGAVGQTDWAPFDVEAPDDTPVPDPADDGASGAGRDPDREYADAVPTPASLHDLIEHVDETGHTLTVCNHTGDDEDLADLRSYFDRHGVAVRTATLSTTFPADVALLHRESEPVSMSPVGEVLDAIRFEGTRTDVEGTAASVVRPDILDRVSRQQYTVENGGKLRLVRISRLVETRALEVGRGTLHAGFQRLDRLRDELGTQSLYERIAATDVDVHVYGRPGAVPNAERYTLHAGDTDELADSWFVVYDGAGDDDQMGALVSEETGPDRYTGFWTYRPELVRAAADYLRSAYRTETATGD